MKLAEFLANYIEQHKFDFPHCPVDEEIVQAGIEAFCSAEDVRVEVVGGTSRIIEEQIV